MTKKIISGGQTGVDRAALDAAMKHGVNCGGWCPAGRLDECGRIPERYPLQELGHGGFAERTRRNVSDAHGTVALYCKTLHGGTEETVRCCREQPRPHLLIDAATISPAEAANLIEQFVREEKIGTLNVAGPRASEWPTGYDFAFCALDLFLERDAPSSRGSVEQQ